MTAANQNYSSEDGLLYNKDKTTLIQCPAKKSGSVILPATLNAISKHAFYNCYGITGVTLPDGLTHIGSYAFANCINLTDIILPNSILMIWEYAFYGCNSLINIVLPGNISYIEDHVFESCSSLVSVTVPDNITHIDDRVFGFCDNLSRVYFLGDAPGFGNQVFYNVTNCTAYKISGTVGWDSAYVPLPVEDLPDFPFHPTLSMIDINGTNCFVVNWNCFSNRDYTVEWTTNLLSEFQAEKTGIEYPHNSYTDSVHNSAHLGFYKVNINFK